MVDILITGGTVITMDPGRRVLEDGAVKTVDESEVLEMIQGNVIEDAKTVVGILTFRMAA